MNLQPLVGCDSWLHWPEEKPQETPCNSHVQNTAVTCLASTLKRSTFLVVGGVWIPTACSNNNKKQNKKSPPPLAFNDIALIHPNPPLTTLLECWLNLQSNLWMDRYDGVSYLISLAGVQRDSESDSWIIPPLFHRMVQLPLSSSFRFLFLFFFTSVIKQEPVS